MENKDTLSNDHYQLHSRSSTKTVESMVILLTQELKVKEVNLSALNRFFKRKKEEVLNKPVFDLLKQEGFDAEKVLAGIHYSSHAFFYRCKLTQLSTQKGYDLSILCIQLESQNYYVLTVKFCDNESYNNLKAYIDAIINNLPGSVYWKDREGHYIGCNQCVVEMAGFSCPEDIIGKTDYDLCWQEFAEEWRKLDKEVMRIGKTISREEQVRLASGRLITELTYKAPLRNEYNEVVGIIGTSLDISDRKKVERELKEAKELAETANRSKTEFLSNMKHDLRTPFVGLLGLSESMAVQETDPDKKANLECIAQSAQTLLNYLNEILEFVKIEDGQLPVSEKCFDLHAVVDEVFTVPLPLAKHKGLEFTLSVDSQLPQMLLGDATRTQRILMNVLTNAIKFTANGFVNLTVSVHEKTDHSVCIDFTVEDSGIGIPRDQQEIIFERFNRVTSSYSGVYAGKGLGLKIVRQFLDEIGGQPYITSELGKGTVFQVLIPYKLPLRHTNPNDAQKASRLKVVKTSMRPELQALKPVSASLNLDKAVQTRVLVVEDNPVAANAVKNTLSGLNCEVDIAEDGQATLSRIETQAYDLIFMDIGLPDMNGYEVTKCIRSHRVTSISQIPVVALTAHADTDNQQVCLDVQINLVLSKPLTLVQAIEVLNLFIPRRQKSVNVTPEPTQRPTEKIIDIDYAKTLLGGDETVVKEMLTMLVNSFPEEIATLKDTYQRKDWETLKAIAHKLKGGASYCGTLCLKSACAALESYVKSGLTDRIPELYQQLLAEIDAVKSAVNECEGIG